jgi:hypothetical protein
MLDALVVPKDAQHRDDDKIDGEQINKIDGEIEPVDVRSLKQVAASSERVQDNEDKIENIRSIKENPVVSSFDLYLENLKNIEHVEQGNC